MSEIVQVLPNLWRGPRPEDLAPLQKLGIKRLINLEFFHRGEDQNPEDFGMIEESLPCSDIFPPSTWVFERILRTLPDEIPTLIHCLSGVDRTGIICAGIRMRDCGWPYEAALLEWVNMGRHPWYFWWNYRLKEWRT